MLISFFSFFNTMREKVGIKLLSLFIVKETLHELRPLAPLLFSAASTMRFGGLYET